MASRPPRPGELLDHHPPTLAAFHDQVAELAHTHGWLTLEADGRLPGADPRVGAGDRGHPLGA
jgi:hypothetical protein